MRRHSNEAKGNAWNKEVLTFVLQPGDVAVFHGGTIHRPLRGETGYGLFVNGFGDEGGRPDILAGLGTVARGKQLVGCVN